jgi:hypothetical protein
MRERKMSKLGLYDNTLGLRLKVFVKVSFFNVDAKRLTAGYHSRRRVHREKKKTLNPSVLGYITLLSIYEKIKFYTEKKVLFDN